MTPCAVPCVGEKNAQGSLPVAGTVFASAQPSNRHCYEYHNRNSTSWYVHSNSPMRTGRPGSRMCRLSRIGDALHQHGMASHPDTTGSGMAARFSPERSFRSRWPLGGNLFAHGIGPVERTGTDLQHMDTACYRRCCAQSAESAHSLPERRSGHPALVDQEYPGVGCAIRKRHVDDTGP
jgi:hypothetical protein